MNIGNKYLRSWLRFDESATKDFIADNAWTTSGNPTISTTNAINGKALQLDGSSYLKLSGVELAGRAFTLDCMAYIDASSPNNARLFSIVNQTTGYFLATVRKSATQSNYIDAWANAHADCSQDYGYTATVTAATGVGNRVHVALIYNPSDSGGQSAIYVAVNGYVVSIITIYRPTYKRSTFDVVIGALPNGNQGLIGSIDEFRIYDGAYLFTDQQGHNFTPPDASFYNTHEFWTDTIRKVLPASAWWYSNEGVIDTLINTTTAVQLTDLPTTQSKTGKAFYQTTQTKIFDVPAAKEIWIKFDVYFNGSKRWRAYDISTGSGNLTGVTAQTSGDISFFNRNTNVYQSSNSAKINGLQTVILHMIADSSNGLIEAYTDDGDLLYAYTGEVNNGTNFGNLYLQSDGAGTFFSNVIISNSPLWFDDNAIEQVDIDYLADAQREISRAETVIIDAERIIYTGLSVSYFADIERELYYAINYLADIAREIKPEISLAFDAERVVSTGASVDYLVDIQRELYHGHDVDYYADVVRDTYINVNLLFDAERQKISTLTFDMECIICNAVEFLLDTEREIIRIEIFNLDTARYLPYHLVVDGTETTIIPVAQNDAGLQSINIMISEQQVTDRVSFVHAGNCDIMDKIQGTYRDYEFDLRIEETTQQGVIQECMCCSDIDEILYSQIAYEIPPNKFEWADDYLEMLGQKRQENPNENIEPEPSTTIEEHLRAVAQKMGKNFVYRGVKYYSTNGVKEQEGRTYASVISDLIGWTSRLPHMMINAYLRAGTMYVIQRGYEANTVVLDGAKIANVRLNKKLIRTTWGSDVVSNTKVNTYTKTWKEYEKESTQNPFPDGSGAIDSEGLIERKTTMSESEKNETTYYYATDDSGARYLEREVTVKYEKNGSGWDYADTITTEHKKVSTTQSHISATNSDGEIIGETVSPNRFDDRPTPYNIDHGHSQYDGYILVHDDQGNYSKIYSIKHMSEEMDMSYYTTYGLSLIDTSFPVYGDDCLSYLTQQLIWLNRKVEETVTMDVYDVNHVIDFDDKISINGVIYYLKSNNILQNEHIINKQSLTLVRWY